MSIVEEIVSQTIRAGGEAVEIEYKDECYEVFPVSGSSGSSVGFIVNCSSQEGISLEEELYKIANKKRRLVVDGSEYELRCRIYQSFMEDAFRLTWKPIKPDSKGGRKKGRP